MAFPIEDQVSDALYRAVQSGVEFIVGTDDSITVLNPERMTPAARQLLRRHWSIARAELLEREHAVRDAAPVSCPHCGQEAGRWIGHNLWVPLVEDPQRADDWRNLGQALAVMHCRECGGKWQLNFSNVPSWGIRS